MISQMEVSSPVKTHEIFDNLHEEIGVFQSNRQHELRASPIWNAMLTRDSIQSHGTQYSPVAHIPHHRVASPIVV